MAMSLKLSRREVVMAALSGSAVAQTNPAQPGKTQEELPSARTQILRNAEVLTKFELPMSTEPAFQFKA
jgi:hypothetical protein